MEQIVETKDYVFHRDFKKTYPIITHGKGIYLYDQNGKRYIDASSGAVAANLGHGMEEIAEAMADQAKKAGFVHTLRFETNVLHELSKEIAELAPPHLTRVYFASGGSEANESAIKLARQFFKGKGKPQKHVIIGRWQSYHGNTLGSLSAGGDSKRRHLYSPLLINFAHVSSPYCAHCPFNRTKEECVSQRNWSCVKEVERTILELGPENISAFIAEPIVGSQQGAVVPPEGYFKAIRDLCDQYEILLIIDEVMTGFGRTGKHFAVEHFGMEPDILTFGKGVSGGYAPLSGMLVHQKIIDGLIQNSQGKFTHGFTYSGHPVSAAAGLAALRIYKREGILSNSIKQGAYLKERLLELKQRNALVIEVQGEGLLLGIELVRDKEKSILFDPMIQAAERINQIAMQRGAVFYPGSGAIDGINGEHLLICPPLIVSDAEIDEIVSILEDSLVQFEKELLLNDAH